MKAFGVKNPQGEIHPDYIKSTSGQAITDFLVQNWKHIQVGKDENSWDFYHRKGYTCVPVEITEIEPTLKH